MARTITLSKNRFLFQLTRIKRGIASTATVSRIRNHFAHRFWSLTPEAEAALANVERNGGTVADAETIWASAVRSAGLHRRARRSSHTTTQ